MARIEDSGHSTQHRHGLAYLELKNIWCFYEEWIPADHEVRLFDFGGTAQLCDDRYSSGYCGVSSSYSMYSRISIVVTHNNYTVQCAESCAKRH